MRLIVLALVLHATWATKHADITGVKPHRHLRRDGGRGQHRRLPPSGSGDNILESQNTGGSGPHPLLEVVDLDTNVNRQGSARPLQLCQGDCTTDQSCAGDLVCFKRNNEFSPTEIPGCDGEARGNTNYCVEAKYSQKFPELTFVGHRGPLGECAGDCDSNEDCMGDLVCYQQSGATDGDDSVPGCQGTAQGNVDYCVRPPTPPKAPTPAPPSPSPPEEESREEEEPAVPVPAPSEPAAPTTESPDDPDDYPFSVFFSTAVLKEPEEDVVAVSETGEEADTEVPVLEGRSNTENEYTNLNEIAGDVLRQLFIEAGYDVSNATLSNRRLVALAHEGVSSQTVPATPTQNDDLPFKWVAIKADYVVTDFTPNNDKADQGGDARRIQEENLDTQQLTGEEIEGEVTGVVSTAIEDGTLLSMLQRRDPNVLGVADFGEEASTDVDTSSIPSPTPEAPEAASDPEPKDSPKQPWWVWFLVALAGFALLVLTIFAVRRRNKDKVSDVPPPPPDDDKGSILALAPTFDNDESDDDEQNAPHWGDGPFDETISNDGFADEQPPPLPPPNRPKVDTVEL